MTISLVIATQVGTSLADPCTSDAVVCDYKIDATHVCANGVGSNSIMAGESTPKNYHAIDAPCGMEWYVGTLVSYPTLNTCGDAVLNDCI